ncbi:ABC transporter ATP-binding protein [Citreicella sp. C3M06]|uniref:ABC transporter ATP-binding protein n=1 Tax=Citreicella sp. C3M06 TaxID=2841564 RepID=UPI001C091A2E|nr:ABC transporter ATP-binding protein [Citreicella sp. C3M06]MBU2960744.1 ABC transporter ATP-binding protein [Citreicella sp. C3M06]
MSLCNVSKRFGDTTVVSDFSLDLFAGEFVALLGASGSGKSTTLRMLAGLERPSSGKVLMDGVDVTDLRPAARNIALMFQSYALYPHLSVRQNIATPLRQTRLSAAARLPGAGLLSGQVRKAESEINARTQSVAQMLRLDGLLERRPGQLSGGQQQRVALARALVRDPSAFLLDEPLSNLDTALRHSTREEIRDLHRRTGHAFLLVTHDQTDALSMADRIVVMIAGRVAQCASAADIYHRPANREVARFIGAHRMNILPPGVEAASFHPRGMQDDIGIRPEALQADPNGALLATLTNAAFHGEETLLRLRTDAGAELLAVTEGTASLPPQGTKMRFGAQAARLHCFDAATGLRKEIKA